MRNPKFNEIVKAITEKMSEILPPGSRGVLYGSQARGDANLDSDWDIHILISGEEELPRELINKYAFPIEEIGYNYGEWMAVMVYSYKGWEKRSFLPYYKNVEKDKLILFEN